MYGIVAGRTDRSDMGSGADLSMGGAVAPRIFIQDKRGQQSDIRRVRQSLSDIKQAHDRNTRSCVFCVR